VTGGEQIDLGRVLGDEDRLALREDDDARHELERRHRGQVSEQHERLVERGAHVVGAVPTAMHVRIGAHHVVVREHVGEAELIDAFPIRAHGADIATELGLREHDPDSHAPIPRRGPTDFPQPRVGGSR
jgi:hypothetical protein